MAPKRPYGTGSLTESPKGSGRWLYKVDRGTDPLTGRRRRVGFRFEAKSPKEANLRANQILADLETEKPLGSRATVEQLLAEFMRFSRARGRSPTTLREYQRIVDSVLLPSIGSISIGELTPHDLDSLYVNAMKGSKPVSASSVRRYHSLVSAALNQAVRWGWLEKSPAARVTLPDSTGRRLQIPTSEEVRALISACTMKDERLGMFVLVAAVTGCRRGEIAALRWTDLSDDVLTVRASAFDVGNEHGIKTTKTGRERLVVVDPLLMQALDSWHSRCNEGARSFGVALGPDSFIFSARPDGARPVNVHTISSGTRIVADSIGLPHVHLHSLRHFAATELAWIRHECPRHGRPSRTRRSLGHPSDLRARDDRTPKRSGGDRRPHSCGLARRRDRIGNGINGGTGPSQFVRAILTTESPTSTLASCDENHEPAPDVYCRSDARCVDLDRPAHGGLSAAPSERRRGGWTLHVRADDSQVTRVLGIQHRSRTRGPDNPHRSLTANSPGHHWREGHLDRLEQCLFPPDVEACDVLG